MSHRVLGLLLAAMFVSACNRAPEAPPPAAPGATDPAPRTAPLSPDMVSAVSGGKASNTVDLKFALASRPEPGRPLAIDIAIIPKLADATIRVIVQNTDGIEITSGQEVSIPKGAAPGVPVSHRVTVMPARDGIFSLSAVALVDTDKVSVTRTFAIPIIVGEGVTPAELGQGAAAAPPAQ